MRLDAEASTSLATSTPLPLTYWDLWALLAARHLYSSSLARLADALFERRADPRAPTTRHQALEDLLALVADLQVRLRPWRSLEEFLAEVPTAPLKKERAKAVRLFTQALEGDPARDLPPSPPMLRSPGRVLDQEALRGQWARLPVNPEAYAERLRPLLAPAKRKAPSPEELAVRLRGAVQDELARIETLVANRRAHRYALHRAAWALRPEPVWLEGLLAATPDLVGASPEIFLGDLLPALLWEPSVDEARIANYLGELWPEEAAVGAKVLKDFERRGRESFRDAQADRAQRHLDAIHANAKRRGNH